MVLPFFVSGKWWGFIGFDQCDTKRNWTVAEIAVLQAAASMIGTAIERENDKQLLELQNEELRKINHELDSFVYSVSHDLRAPLVTILGLVNIAEKEPLSPNLTLYLQHIRSSILRLDNFIKEILEYSRNTRTEAHLETVNLKDLLSEMCSSIFLTDSSVDVTINFSEENYILLFDKKRLSVILTNVLNNAFKFRDLNKTNRYVKVDASINSEILMICVEDNGIGIDKDHLPKIFDMFYRASEKNHGSGLGLYITKEVVNKLNGEIKIESEFEKYTRIIFKLPVSAIKE
ncbi:MAG: ATP-binding protein [Cyclobacteriaceae bacterium]|nr:ATP-binding protein [Cyclobacteriaceae bacterium]